MIFMKFEYEHFTDKGSRPVNEDFADMVSKKDSSCFILCDGLGGHGMGDEASRFIVRFVKEYFLKCSSTEEFLSNVIEKAHNAIHEKQRELSLGDKMKTTCVIFVIDKDKGISIHVGDSRLYQFRDNIPVFCTKDHSIPQMLVKTGEISESEIRSHPDRNKLLRALGDNHETQKFDRNEFQLLSGDVFFLCSDGFWEPVTESEMSALLQSSGNIHKWLKNMAKLAKENSSGKNMDNFTGIAVKIKG